MENKTTFQLQISNNNNNYSYHPQILHVSPLMKNQSCLHLYYEPSHTMLYFVFFVYPPLRREKELNTW